MLKKYTAAFWKRVMTSRRSQALCGIILLAGVLAAGLLAAQTRPKQGECLPDEMDMGDYCASLPPAITGEEKENRRVTRFRGSSMMPGKTSEATATTTAPLEPAPSPVELVPSPVELVPTEGFIVQLGAFSTRELAESVATSVESPGPPFHVLALDSGDRVLWACIQGPFPDRDSAVKARDFIRGNRKFRSAYIKSIDPALLESEKEQGMTNDSTKK